mmetsp:Transcript_7325/g.11484  ORF Transcript_7325/g.11484 Transcript_7325/m.11484 type:complete len:81 (-) Transcript_7325:3-245(-)
MFDPELDLGYQRVDTNLFFLNGLKKRSSQLFNVTVNLVDPRLSSGFYKGYHGKLETVASFEPSAISSKLKRKALAFQPLD